MVSIIRREHEAPAKKTNRSREPAMAF